MRDRGGTRSACLAPFQCSVSPALPVDYALSLFVCVRHVYALLASNARLSRSRSACSYIEGTIIVRRGLTRGCGSSEVIEPRPWKPASAYSHMVNFNDSPSLPFSPFSLSRWTMWRGVFGMKGVSFGEISGNKGRTEGWFWDIRFAVRWFLARKIVVSRNGARKDCGFRD